MTKWLCLNSTFQAYVTLPTGVTVYFLYTSLRQMNPLATCRASQRLQTVLKLGHSYFIPGQTSEQQGLAVTDEEDIDRYPEGHRLQSQVDRSGLTQCPRPLCGEGWWLSTSIRRLRRQSCTSLSLHHIEGDQLEPWPNQCPSIQAPLSSLLCPHLLRF